jgi:hypothetical protein|tara:strand:+ start:171 stop:512 length:342 start_codon:yes stop_codon:yes gene_type:complete
METNIEKINKIKNFKKETKLLDQELNIVRHLMIALDRAADDWYRLEAKSRSYDSYSFFGIMFDLVYYHCFKENLDRKKQLPHNFFKKISKIIQKTKDGNNPYYRSKNRNECDG